jgi:hypothetical protein
MSHLSEDQLDQIIAEERSREWAPLNEWRTIAARAREEGLIRESRSSQFAQPWMQAAAAVLLLIGGIAIGRTTIGLPSAIPPSANNSPASATAPNAGSNVASRPESEVNFASVDEASQALDSAVAQYRRASEFIAAANNASIRSRDSLDMYSARVAALDKIMNATASALKTAPDDPVINQYYLATMGARVATQQLVARPVGLRGF